MSERMQSDITIVGGGVAGLWTAKELVDQNYSVTLVESSDFLATGATTKNEGWLHAGTYHSVAIENEREILPVTENTIASHRAIVAFAPESIDHTATYALTVSDDMTHKAITRWRQTGVAYEEVSKRNFADNDGIDTDRLSGVLRSKIKASIHVYYARN